MEKAKIVKQQLQRYKGYKKGKNPYITIIRYFTEEKSMEPNRIVGVYILKVAITK